LIRSMIDPTTPLSAESHDRLRAGFQAILTQIASAPPEAAPAPVEAKAEPAVVSTVELRIAFAPHLDFFQNGSNPLGILAELATMGNCQTTTKLDGIPRLEDLDPENCHLGFDIRLQTSKSENEIRDVFIFVEDRCDLSIQVQATPSDDSQDLATTATYLPAVGSGEISQGSPLPATTGNAPPANRPSDGASSIRVSAQKLDNLVDLVGELVIAQARLAQVASTRGDDQLFSVAEDIGRLSAELRDSTLDIRMVPIGTTFVRFRRLVHDLSSELGKEIQLETDGADTELDKTMIERLFDPLVHLIRNSCDHGIESPEARQRAGKNAAGTVRLTAYHSGQNVVLEIKDDGAGLDPVAIRRKAIDSELIDKDGQLPPEEIYKLIFLPGFSTAKAVTNLSGRGVGMDVVKRSVEALRGQIEIASELGKGTTIRLQLPLTLAIIEGLLVDVGAGKFVLPMAMVEECVELTTADVERSHHNRLAIVRGELVPYIRLRDWFGNTGERPDIEQIAITTAEGKRFGFVVDSVVGQHQTVIKSLGRMYQHVRGLSGATILGDGTLALIVDVPALLRTVQQAA
jgi:two-component system, chemotaxis family, sensor kinase CheA